MFMPKSPPLRSASMDVPETIDELGDEEDVMPGEWASTAGGLLMHDTEVDYAHGASAYFDDGDASPKSARSALSHDEQWCGFGFWR